MRVELLKSAENIVLSPETDTQYVLIPTGLVNVEMQMETSDVSAELIALYSLKDSNEVTLSTKSIHAVPNTTCMVNVKVALFDSSRSNYEGRIIIKKPAQQTVSYLEDNVLIIGEKIKNHSQPILEIEADDVKASHGATSGRIDELQIYYLMSRGLTRIESEKIIIEGFFEAALSKIQNDEVKAQALKELYV